MRVKKWQGSGQEEPRQPGEAVQPGAGHSSYTTWADGCHHARSPLEPAAAFDPLLRPQWGGRRFPEARSGRTREAHHLLPVSTCPPRTSGSLIGQDSVTGLIRPDGARPPGATACPWTGAGGQEGGTSSRARSSGDAHGHLHWGLCWCVWSLSGPLILMTQPLGWWVGCPHHWCVGSEICQEPLGPL